MAADARSPFSNPVGQAKEAAAAYVAALLAMVGDRDPLPIMRELVPSLRSLLAGLPPDVLHRPERPGKWSMLGVVEHLVDQETVNAFRWRVVIAEDDPPVQGYDQDRWAARLRYDTTDPETLLAELDLLRRRNLRLLEALAPAEWKRVGHHAERGPESVERLTVMIAGHDLVHRNQIARIRAAVTSTRAP